MVKFFWPIINRAAWPVVNTGVLLCPNAQATAKAVAVKAHENLINFYNPLKCGDLNPEYSNAL
jgi:hypothetical protein